MKRYLIITLLISLLAIVPSKIFAQHTTYSNAENTTFRSALELYEQNNFGSAIAEFEKFMKEHPDKNNALYEDANYYTTMSAIELRTKDAENMVARFVADFPSSAWLPSVNFELGNIYYKEKKYSKALTIYNDVQPTKLTPAKRNEYWYKRGYCLMKKSKYDAALSAYTKVMKTKSSYAKPASYYYAHIQYQKENFDEALSGFKAIANDRKFKSYVPLYLVKIYYQLGDFNNSISEGLLHIENAKSSEKGEIARLVANSYYNLGDYNKAHEYFTIFEQFSRDNNDPEEQYRIGYCKFIKEDYKSAVSNFQSATRASGIIEQNSWYYLGYCYLFTGQTKFAQNAFLKAYRQNDNKDIAADALFSYVKITIELGKDSYNDPVTVIEEYIENNPQSQYSETAYDLLSQLYLTSKNYPAALKSIEKVSRPNNRLQGVYQQLAYAQGVEYFNRRSYKDAIQFFQKSLNYPIDKKLAAEAIFWQGDSYYRLKQYGTAAQKFNSFLNAKGASQTNLVSTATYNAAYCAFNTGRYADASWLFRKFIKMPGADMQMVNDSYLRLADSYIITKDYKNAIQYYDKVIGNRSSDADYAMFQKAICYGSQGDFKSKLNTLGNLINSYKGSEYYDDALYDMASTNLIMNDQRNAIVYFDRLVKEKPKSSFAKKALVKMGFVYYSNNQYDQAVKSLRKVIDSYPASLEAKEALVTLQNVYMDMGQIDTYIDYANSLDFVQVSTSEEDSLKYITGENYYINGDCDNAIPAFKKYITDFPQGGFVLSAYHYITVCYEKKGDKDTALEYHKKIIEFPDNQYTVIALLKVARAMYESEDFDKALSYYQRLSQSAEDKLMILEAKDGIMKSAWKTQNIPVVKDAANELLRTDKVGEDQIIYAHYLLGQIALTESNFGVAEREFGITNNLSKGELGAEALYNLALLSYKQNNLDKAEEYVYQLPESYPGYDYWIAKGFILLADIYVGRENIFQAEQTLNSVIENHKGEELRKVAQGKLDRLQEMQKPKEEETEGENQ